MKSFCYVTLIALGLALSTGLTSALAQNDENPNTEAYLSGLSENPVVISPGSGMFAATFVEGPPGTGTITGLTYRLTYRDLKSTTYVAGVETPGMVTQVHIHIGKEWENGGVVVALCSNLADAPAGTPACPQPTAAAPEVTVEGMIVASAVQAAGIGEATEIIQAGDLQALKQIMIGGGGLCQPPCRRTPQRRASWTYPCGVVFLMRMG